MRQIISLMLGALCLLACTAMPPSTFDAPLHPISFLVSPSSLAATLVRDQRPESQRITQTIREFDTTTLLIADNYLTPAPPILLASKLLERDPRFDQTVALQIFLISVYGRSPRTPNTITVPVVSSRAMVFVAIPLPVITSATASLPPPPGGYSADLLRVAIEGEVNGATFAAKESIRLSGTVTQDQIKQLVDAVADDAARKILDLSRESSKSNAR